MNAFGLAIGGIIYGSNPSSRAVTEIEAQLDQSCLSRFFSGFLRSLVIHLGILMPITGVPEVLTELRWHDWDNVNHGGLYRGGSKDVLFALTAADLSHSRDGENRKEIGFRNRCDKREQPSRRSA